MHSDDKTTGILAKRAHRDTVAEFPLRRFSMRHPGSHRDFHSSSGSGDPVKDLIRENFELARRPRYFSGETIIHGMPDTPVVKRARHSCSSASSVSTALDRS